MTTAQQDADSAVPRDLSDAAANREAAKAWIEQYMREHDGALPSGLVVGAEFGMTDKWGRNQLKQFRSDTAADGTPPRRIVADLVAERSGAADDPSPVTLVVGTAGPERPPARSAARPPERPMTPAAAAPERSAPATKPASGTPGVRSGTPTSAATGTGWWVRNRRKASNLVALSPLLAIAAGAFVSIWGGWVGLGKLTGFGEIELLPGIVAGWKFDTAITLPLGMEAYAAYALKVWLAPPADLSDFGQTFARRSAIAALILGAAGQIAYHLMAAAEVEHAHWLITAFVACLPVGVLGCGAALMHLVRHPEGRS
jgi:hypothetical protein